MPLFISLYSSRLLRQQYCLNWGYSTLLNSATRRGGAIYFWLRVVSLTGIYFVILNPLQKHNLIHNLTRPPDVLCAIEHHSVPLIVVTLNNCGLPQSKKVRLENKVALLYLTRQQRRCFLFDSSGISILSLGPNHEKVKIFTIFQICSWRIKLLLPFHHILWDKISRQTCMLSPFILPSRVFASRWYF